MLIDVFSVSDNIVKTLQTNDIVANMATNKAAVVNREKENNFKKVDDINRETRTITIFHKHRGGYHPWSRYLYNT